MSNPVQPIQPGQATAVKTKTKTDITIVTSLLVILAVFGFIFFAAMFIKSGDSLSKMKKSSQSVTPVAPSTAICTDSDGGKNYDIYGEVTGWNNTPSQTITIKDSCINAGAGDKVYNLSEAYCSGSYATVNWYNCPRGCQNGACIKPGADNILKAE